VVQAHLPDEADERNDHFRPLDAVEDVSDYWEDSPRPKYLHILVQKPSGASQNTSQYIVLTIFFFITRRSHSSLRSPHPSSLCQFQSTSNFRSRGTARYVATTSSLNHVARPLQDLQSLLSVNCLLLGDDSTKAFTVKIPESENVSILKELIKEKNTYHLAHLDAKDLILYKVTLSSAEVDARLKEANTDSKVNTAFTRNPLLTLKKLKEVFPEALQEDHVHIIIEHGSGTCPRHWWISSSDVSY